VQTAIGEVVKANLAAVGLDVTVNQVDLNTEEDTLGEGQYFSTTDEWGDYQPDPTVQPEFAVNPKYCCDSYFTSYDSPSEIAALNRAIAATNPSQRKVLFDDLQRDMAQSAQVIPLFFPELTYVSTKNLAGFFAYPNNLYAYEQWQLK
jgi:ABC-type transport system substrate-binding protein